MKVECAVSQEVCFRVFVQEPSESVLQVSMGYINPLQAAPWFSHWSLAMRRVEKEQDDDTRLQWVLHLGWRTWFLKGEGACHCYLPRRLLPTGVTKQDSSTPKLYLCKIHIPIPGFPGVWEMRAGKCRYLFISRIWACLRVCTLRGTEAGTASPAQSLQTLEGDFQL